MDPVIDDFSESLGSSAADRFSDFVSAGGYGSIGVLCKAVDSGRSGHNYRRGMGRPHPLNEDPEVIDEGKSGFRIGAILGDCHDSISGIFLVSADPEDRVIVATFRTSPNARW